MKSSRSCGCAGSWLWLDASGGSVASFADIGRTYLPDGNSFSVHDVQLLQAVPVVSAVMGSVAGLPAVNACLAHFNVMVRGTAQLFPGGPPVVKAATGQGITKEELGGSDLHTRRSGVVDNVAPDEEDAIWQIRAFLSYLPFSTAELPPRAAAAGPRVAPDDLRRVVPESRRQPFDVYAILGGALDAGSFFEIAPRYGPSRVTRLGRVNGFPVGVMANNPRRLGGATDVAAGEKVMRLLGLCDEFHLPLVTFGGRAGVPGRPGVGAAGDRAGRRPAGPGHVPVPDAVVHVRDLPAVRGGRAVPAPARRDVPPVCLALGPVGVDAHPGRRVRGLPTGHRGRG